MNGKNISQGLLKVIENLSTHSNGAHNRRKIIVHQHQRRSFTRHISSFFAHGNTNVGSFERRCIIDPIARHGNDFIVLFQCIYNLQFLFGHYTCKNIYIANAFAKFVLRQLFQFAACNKKLRVLNPYFPPDIGGCHRIITCNHDHAYSGFITLGYSKWHIFSDRIRKPYQAQKFEIKIMLNGRKFALRDFCSCHTEYSQSSGRHIRHCFFILSYRLLIQMAKIENSFGGTFSSNHLFFGSCIRKNPRHSQQFLRQRILFFHHPIGMNMLRILQILIPDVDDCFFHRVERICLT